MKRSKRANRERSGVVAKTKNRFFIRRFRTFFIIMIIPTLITFVLFMGFMESRFKNTLVVQGNNTLSGVETNFDVVIRNAVYQQNLMTSNYNMTLSLKKLIISNGSYDYSDDVFLNDLGTALRSDIYSRPYIDSIYLYFDGYDDFFTSTENKVAAIGSYYDSDWYQDYISDSSMHHQWIVKRTINRYDYAPPEAVLSVFQRMSSTNGVIVLNINENKLTNILNSIVTDKNEFLFMLDSSNSMILSNQGDSGPEQEIKDGFFQKYPESKDLSGLSGKWISIGGKSYLLNFSNYPESQINFVSLISQNALFNQFSKFLLNFLLIFFTNCLIVLLLSYITTKRIFNQIDYMIQVFSDAENGRVTKTQQKHKTDEYDLIMNNIIHLFIKTTKMKTELLERQHRLEIAERTALQLQINPHFLVNTLQTMDLEVLKQVPAASSVDKMIHELSDILKYALADPVKPVSLGDELNYLKEYVDIQKYRFGDRFIVYYEVGDELLDCRVFRLMLQPLLENSIVHGVRSIDRQGFIKIKIFRKDNRLHIRVVDNGVGLTRKEINAVYARINDKNGKSIGLTNVNSRLKLVYGDECGLRIRGKKGRGTSISFRIPAQ